MLLADIIERNGSHGTWSLRKGEGAKSKVVFIRFGVINYSNIRWNKRNQSLQIANVNAENGLLTVTDSQFVITFRRKVSKWLS